MMQITKRYKRIIFSVLTFPLVYILISLGLIFFPVPDRQVVSNKTLDFSNLNIEPELSFVIEKTFKARDNTDIFYRYFPAQTNTTVILIHGSSAESRYLSKLANAISFNGYANVIAVDLRGHGRTVSDRGDVNYIGQLEDDISDIVDSLKSDNVNSKIILAGHSSGGGLVVRYAGNPLASVVDGYILYAPYLGHDAPTTKANSGGWAVPYIPRIIGLSMLNNLGVHSFDHLPVIHFNLPEKYNDGLRTTTYSHRLNVSYAPRDYIKDLSRINVPLLLLVGADDEAFYADRFANEIEKYSAGKTVLINDTDHLGLVSDEMTIAETIKWLENLYAI